MDEISFIIITKQQPAIRSWLMIKWLSKFFIIHNISISTRRNRMFQEIKLLNAEWDLIMPKNDTWCWYAQTCRWWWACWKERQKGRHIWLLLYSITCEWLLSVCVCVGAHILRALYILVNHHTHENLISIII